MLFPGAIVIVIAIFTVIGGCFSIAIGCVGGIIIGSIFKSIINNTKLHKRMMRGEDVGDYPWWIDHRRWFFIGWCLTTCITVYVIAGPIFTFIKWLG